MVNVCRKMSCKLLSFDYTAANVQNVYLCMYGFIYSLSSDFKSVGMDPFLFADSQAFWTPRKLFASICVCQLSACVCSCTIVCVCVCVCVSLRSFHYAFLDFFYFVFITFSNFESDSHFVYVFFVRLTVSTFEFILCHYWMTQYSITKSKDRLFKLLIWIFLDYLSVTMKFDKKLQFDTLEVYARMYDSKLYGSALKVYRILWGISLGLFISYACEIAKRKFIFNLHAPSSMYLIKSVRNSHCFWQCLLELKFQHIIAFGILFLSILYSFEEINTNANDRSITGLINGWRFFFSVNAIQFLQWIWFLKMLRHMHAK